MIRLKTPAEIEIMREGGRRLAVILDELSKLVKPGVSVAELNEIGHKMMIDGGDKPSFLNYSPRGAKRPYPASICICVNEEIVHGIPNEDPRTLQEGDIVTLDAGLTHKGLINDHAITLPVGEISKEDRRLLSVTKEALQASIKAIEVGGRIGDISSVIEAYADKAGLSVVRQLSGHGVGFDVHEDPFVPNYGRKGTGERIVPGMVLAIEPIFARGDGDMDIAQDGYTCITSDGSNSAQFEHTVAITEDGPIILTKK